MLVHIPTFLSFFLHDPATTEIYTLSLHDALPISPFDRNRRRTLICGDGRPCINSRNAGLGIGRCELKPIGADALRSEEHTSELQSLRHLVCRLLLEKKKDKRR